MATTVLQHEKVWFDKFKYEDAERQYYENLSKVSAKSKPGGKQSPKQAKSHETKKPCAETKKQADAHAPAKVSVVKHESPVIYEKVWLDKYKYDDAERLYFENLSKPVSNGAPPITAKPTSKNSAQTPVCKVKNSSSPKSSPAASVSTSNPLYSPVSPPICKMKTSPQPAPKSSPPVPVSNPVNPESSAPVELQTTNMTNIKTKTVVIAGADTNYENAANNKNKEKRFKVKDKTRNKKKEEREKNAINSQVSSNNPIMKNTLADEVAKARQHIQNSLECMDGIAALTTSNKEAELLKRIGNLENTNKNLQNDVTQLKETVGKLSMLINDLQKKCAVTAPAASAAPVCSKPAQPSAAAAAKKPVDDDDDDDGVDLFGSDSEEDDDEAKKIREKRLAEYANKKAKKPVLIAKSNIILDVKPWDDETNMQELEKAVRQVTTEGLVWGASKLVPLAYGIHKLQISCVVEDDIVSVDWLQETIQEIEDYVQSVDIAAFNKV